MTSRCSGYARAVVLMIVCCFGLSIVIAACHESEVEYTPPDGHSTDSAPGIAGRDTSHRVPSDSDSLGVGTDLPSSTDSQNDSGDTYSGTDSDTSVRGTDSTTGDTGTETDSGGITGTWTLMVYMAADANLEQDMLSDLRELSEIETPSWLTIVILFDRHLLYDISDGNWTGTRLFRVNPSVENGLERLSDATYLGVAESGDNEELDMGDVDTLERFIQFSAATFPAEHYGLVLSGHGNGWMKKGAGDIPAIARTICSDDSGTVEGISIQKGLRPLLQRHAIDVLGFDACLMAMVEVAWAVKDSVQYMIASEGNEASYGWDYKTWITEWLASNDFTPFNLARLQVVSYRRYHEVNHLSPWLMTMAVIDTHRLDALGTAINNLVAGHVLSEIVSGAMTFDTYYKDYYDLRHIADIAGDDALRQAIEAVVVFSWNSDGADIPGGLSIMFHESIPADYRQTAFCIDLDWC